VDKQYTTVIPICQHTISLLWYSAGIGRTGTFIALDILTEQGQVVGYVDPFGCVTELRNQRVSMVQTVVNLISFTPVFAFLHVYTA